MSKPYSETSVTASDWIDAFKGPTVCAKRFSRVSPLRLTLVRERENVGVPDTVTTDRPTDRLQNDYKTTTDRLQNDNRLTRKGRPISDGSSVLGPMQNMKR